ALAEASEGRVVGVQRGYKLTTACTGEEYHHWRNAMKSQADKMTARILQADRVFYARRPVSSGCGILPAGTPEPEYAI
ncbi:MAG TPA: hypothetical protein VNO52_15815, partial [Methylomirabilota bacterium]|nr:hypothetical protein [Methylomirabilota bacterium]